MANEVTEVTKPIYQGTELKFLLEIESEGFSMQEDDFYIVIKNMKNEKVIQKAEMLITGEVVTHGSNTSSTWVIIAGQ